MFSAGDILPVISVYALGIKVSFVVKQSGAGQLRDSSAGPAVDNDGKGRRSDGT